MRRLIAIAAIAALFSSCNQNTAPAEKTDAMAAKPDSLSYAFKAGYSSSFTIGEAAHAKIVLDIWKAYDDNNLAATKPFWADSVTMQFAEGFTFKGGIDSLLAGGKKDREQYSSVVDSVDAWIPLHSTDKNEDWVGIWAREYTTTVKGKKDTMDIHEIWQFKNSKVVYVAQYKGKHK